MSDIEYAIIGGGAIGRSIAYTLSRSSSASVVVIDRCRHDQLENQSTRNSGVIHAGIYYKESVRPLKARLCVTGNAMLYEFCDEFQVHHARTGKLVVATTSEEEAYLDDVYQTAVENRVPGVAMLSQAETRAMEPNVAATRALHAPSSGVIDAVGFLAALRCASSAHNLDGTRVVNVSKIASGFQLSTVSGNRKESFVAKTIINAAGLYADEIARMVNADSPYTIVPVRGEAAKFYSTRRPELAMTGMNVYPVPSGFYKSDGRRTHLPFARYQELLAKGEIIDTLGVHLTPTLDESGAIAKTVTVCPAIRAGVDKEDYGGQLHPPAYYWERVHAFFPGLQVADLELHQAGIQARLADHLDWIIEADESEACFINLIAIDSPGLTAALAIARYVVDDLLAT